MTKNQKSVVIYTTITTSHSSKRFYLISLVRLFLYITDNQKKQTARVVYVGERYFKHSKAYDFLPIVNGNSLRQKMIAYIPKWARALS